MTDLSLSLDTELADLDLSAHIEEPTVQRSEPANNVVALPKVKRKAPQVYAFDYSGISTAVAKEAEATAKRIRDRLRAHTIDTGKELLKVKRDLGHGRFGKWLEFHFGWKERTAQNYMNSAQAFGSTPQVIDILPPSTVYKLAAKNTPEALRQSVIDEIKRGETPDPKKIERRIAEIKTEARQKGNADESIQSGNVIVKHENNETGNPAALQVMSGAAQETPSTEAAQAQDSGVTTIETSASVGQLVDQTEKQQNEKLELAAKRVASLLRKRLGVEFESVRKAILVIDYRVFQQAIREA